MPNISFWLSIVSFIESALSSSCNASATPDENAFATLTALEFTSLMTAEIDKTYIMSSNSPPSFRFLFISSSIAFICFSIGIVVTFLSSDSTYIIITLVVQFCSTSSIRIDTCEPSGK